MLSLNAVRSRYVECPLRSALLALLTIVCAFAMTGDARSEGTDDGVSWCGVVGDTIGSPFTNLQASYRSIRFKPIDLATEIGCEYQTIFLVMPDNSLSTTEINTLKTFIESGEHKRLVLVGEHGFGWAEVNERLNDVVKGLGLAFRFNTSDEIYDNNGYGSISVPELCPVNSASSFMKGVTGIYDDCVGAFGSTAGECSIDPTNATPLAYVWEDHSLVWIVSATVPNGGTVIGMHDSDALYFCSSYKKWETTPPSMNYKFLYNICSRGSRVDLDIDSDNNSDYDKPERSCQEDSIENDQSEPGKSICTNDDDSDEDGIPDFADGFDHWSDTDSDKETAGEQFVPLVLDVGALVDLSKAGLVFRFTYSASDPSGVTRTGSQSSGYTYTPATGGGKLRIWTKNGNVARKESSVKAGGHFVPAFNESDASNTSLTPNELGLGPMPDGKTITEVTLYVEGMPPSQEVSDSIRVTVVDGSVTLEDTVRVKVKQAYRVNLAIDSNNNGSIDPADGKVEDDPKNAKLIPANNGSSDGDAIPDYADGFDLYGDDGDDNTTSGEQFTPLELEIEAPLDPANCQVKFCYSASDPGAIPCDVERSGTSPDYTYSLQENAGHLRIWKVDGDNVSSRAKAAVPAGNYVPSDEFIACTDLDFSTTNRKVRFYVEGISPSARIGDQTIKAIVKCSDGSASDSVLVTVYGLSLEATPSTIVAGGKDSDEHKSKITATSVPQGASNTSVTFERQGGDGVESPAEITESSGSMPGAFAKLKSSDAEEDVIVKAIQGETAASVTIRQDGGSAKFYADPEIIPVISGFSLIKLQLRPSADATKGIKGHQVMFSIESVEVDGNIMPWNPMLHSGSYGDLANAGPFTTDDYGGASAPFVAGPYPAKLNFVVEDLDVLTP